MRFVFAAAVVSLGWPLSWAVAQGGVVTEGYVVHVEGSHVSAFEEGLRRHNEFHAERGESWAWLVWSNATGAVGDYVIMTPGHDWADFDDRPVPYDEDAAHFYETAGSHAASVTAMMWEDLPDVSRLPGEADWAPALVQVYDFELLMGHERAVMEMITKFKDAADAAQWPGQFGWNRSLSGDGPPTISVFVPQANWAGFGAEMDDVWEVMTAHHGEEEAMRLMRGFEQGVRPLSSRIWMFRADLSYMP